jgi:diguanylate cyclase (GGDEF)-like protein
MLIKDREEERSHQLQALLQEREEMARQLEQKMSKLNELAYVDPLTGLANRRRFDKVFLEQITVAIRDKQPLSLIVMDIDHFKNVNDTFGHPVGDEALRLVAEVIAKCTRSTDHRARIGGEEMAILLLGANPDVGKRIAEEIRSGVERIALSHVGRKVPLSMSLGGTTFQKDGNSDLVGATTEFIAGRTMQIADAALYAAKQSGRNRVYWSTSSKIKGER